MKFERILPYSFDNVALPEKQKMNGRLSIFMAPSIYNKLFSIHTRRKLDGRGSPLFPLNFAPLRDRSGAFLSRAEIGESLKENPCNKRGKAVYLSENIGNDLPPSLHAA